MKTSLKLRKKTPKGYFRLGRHKVGMRFKMFDLNADEVKQMKDGKKLLIITKKEYDDKRAKKVSDASTE